MCHPADPWLVPACLPSHPCRAVCQAGQGGHVAQLRAADRQLCQAQVGGWAVQDAVICAADLWCAEQQPGQWGVGSAPCQQAAPWGSRLSTGGAPPAAVCAAHSCCSAAFAGPHLLALTHAHADVGTPCSDKFTGVVAEVVSGDCLIIKDKASGGGWLWRPGQGCAVLAACGATGAAEQLGWLHVCIQAACSRVCAKMHVRLALRSHLAVRHPHPACRRGAARQPEQHPRATHGHAGARP